MPNIAIRQPNLLLPGPKLQLPLWPVVACDQYTSQPKYWHPTEAHVGDQPSTLRLILPEIYLGAGDEQRIAAIHQAMAEVLREALLQEHRGCVLVERTTDGPHGPRTRYGVVAGVDLECYDYRRGSTSLIRPDPPLPAQLCVAASLPSLRRTTCTPQSGRSLRLDLHPESAAGRVFAGES